MYINTQQKVDKVLELYNEGKTVQEIIRALDVPTSKKTVKKILASFGIDYTAELAIKEAAKPIQIIEMYKAGRSMLEIQADLKLTWSTVRDILDEAGVDMRSLSQQGVIKHGNTLDDTVFNELTPEALYWIGVLYADGHVHRSGWYGIELTLHSDDVELLWKFAKFLKSNKEPQKVKNSNCYRFAIGSEVIHKRLTGLGFGPDKSYTAKPHDLLKHFRDFWRGVIDGDGSLQFPLKGYRRPILHLCGTEATCEGFKEFILENDIQSKASVRQLKGDQAWVIQHEYVAAEHIATLLYKDATIYMERKYQKYLQFIEPTGMYEARAKKTI